MSTRDRVDYLAERWQEARPDLEISSLAVWGRVTLINELFHLAIGGVLKSHKLTFSEFQALAAIFLSGAPFETNPNQIARQNLLTSGGMTNLLNKMALAGLVSRRPDEHDRRGVIVSLTPSGEQRIVACMSEENRLEQSLLQGLSEEEAAMLTILLRKLLTSLQIHSGLKV